jgi:Lar family restriction alleviation protein
MSELKPCPFCGGTAFLDKDEIFCDMCGLRMPFPIYEYGAVDGVEGFPTWEQAREEAVRRWNRRANNENA